MYFHIQQRFNNDRYGGFLACRILDRQCYTNVEATNNHNPPNEGADGLVDLNCLDDRKS